MAAIGFAVVYHRGRTYGATRAERQAPMPGDDLVDSPQVVATHAATLPAPPNRVWPWLTQVGWHRGGWYTPRWVDVLLFPDNWPSADRLLPDTGLAVGDTIPDGLPESRCFFVVRELEAPRRMVLESTTHLPLGWRERRRARLHWTWSFVLEPVDHGRRTRLVFRWRARTAPWWITAGAHLLIVPADLVMSRGMLRGLRRRVAAAPSPSPR
ncbi:hypothetical protein GCM10009606_27130 [Nocardioides aquiterrae]|uniref:SRPBCC family protein n=1 Tax=Nocardioides aquiterrae TaxID=203799 RepID=A0ABP4EYH5_9ACTN